jgi:hypothetical protein
MALPFGGAESNRMAQRAVVVLRKETVDRPKTKLRAVPRYRDRQAYDEEMDEKSSCFRQLENDATSRPRKTRRPSRAEVDGVW